jgi:hypothetical protein
MGPSDIPDAVQLKVFQKPIWATEPPIAPINR